MPRLVVLGGGACGPLADALARRGHSVTVVANVVDDGGSSGRLRRRFGGIAPGDARACLAAVSRFDAAARFMEHRVRLGPLRGHAVGNLTLVLAARVLRSYVWACHLHRGLSLGRAAIVPISTQDHHLIATCADGRTVRGESAIAGSRFGIALPRLTLSPAANISEAAARAIRRADAVVIAPGSTLTSLFPIMLVDGLVGCLADKNTIWVSNLEQEPGHTEGFDAEALLALWGHVLGSTLPAPTMIGLHSCVPSPSPVQIRWGRAGAPSGAVAAGFDSVRLVTSEKTLTQVLFWDFGEVAQLVEKILSACGPGGGVPS